MIVLKFTLSILFFCPTVLFAHGDIKHKEKSAPKIIKKKDNDKDTIKLITQSYMRNVESIFQQKCMDCHAVNKNLPWYSKLPIAKGIINSDIKEAKKHLDMTDGFPFKGHGDIKGDFKAIAKAVKNESMPPTRYMIMNWNSSLSEEEKEKINEWINQSTKLLEKENI